MATLPCPALQLLLPLTNSKDVEVQRLAAHALANLSVLPENQILMAAQGTCSRALLSVCVCVCVCVLHVYHRRTHAHGVPLDSRIEREFS
ncbi:hypothetical protein EON62_01510 [archaeon]|nr:MAG: hypothetical protein EON62_01510 [archaeon]